MNEVELFAFPQTGQQVRTVLIDGEPWFVAADVCAVLGYAHTTSALRMLRSQEKGVRQMHTPGGLQDLTVINEPGLYRLIMRSNRPAAEAFQDWVTGVVLPQIRRTGSYAAPQFELPQSFADALELAARQARAIEAANARIGELEPSAQAWNVLASAHGDYSVREAAFILNRDPSISTGQKRLFAALRELRLIDGRDIPYAAHERHVTLRSRHFEHPRTGERKLSQQVRITADGLRYLHKKLGGSAPFESLIGDAA
ncbi:phage antirepressor [Streptosporangium sandarakinum]